VTEASRLRMALAMLRIGATSYGGPAIVAQIRQLAVAEKRWVSEGEFQECLALCQVVPGPTAIQTATLIGLRLHGPAGAALALVSYVTPAFVSMLLLSAAYFRLQDVPMAAATLRGLGAAVVAIVAHSILSMARSAVAGPVGVGIAASAAAALIAGLAGLPVLAAAAATGVMATRLWPGAWGPPGAARPTGGAAGVGASGSIAAPLSAVLLLAISAWASGFVSPRLPPLAIGMARVNLLSFGGGYTALALMYEEAVGSSAHRWLTEKEFVDGIALGQITPGPVILTAAFVGYRVAGLLGATLATLAVLLPSASLLVAVSPHFARIRHLAPVRGAVRGLLAAFIALLLSVLAGVSRSALAGPFELLLAVGAFAALRLGVGMPWIVLASVLASLVTLR
jgi:chromate transporter